MRPDPARVLQGVAFNLATQVMQEIQTPFGAQSVGICATLAIAVAQEVDRLVDRLLNETVAIASLLADAAPLLSNTALRERAFGAPSRTPPPNYRVSTLQAMNDAVRALFIEVHAAIEQTPGEAAAAMNERFWAELQESTMRRKLELGR